MTATVVRIEGEALRAFCREVFQNLGLSEPDARIAATVLVAADAMGIPSHGTGRLGRYVNGLRTGQILARAEFEILREGPTSLVIDAHGAMGAPTSARAMELTLAKAGESGLAFTTVRDSNHFGIAAYWARMALERDMIGIAMTNTAALGVPTFGSMAMFGTNPLAFAAPAQEEEAFVLDMSTTVVTRGKLEVYERLGKELPQGWAVDKNGLSTKDAGAMLKDMQARAGGGILPLGGLGMEFGGHKGYGLAVMVDILCALLSASSFGAGVYDTETSSARVSHSFGAIKIDHFREPREFRLDMDRMLTALRQAPRAEGQERIYYAGLPERESEKESERLGVPILGKTYDALCEIGKEWGAEGPVPIPSP